MKLNEYYLIDVIDGLKTLKDESVDIIIADPPYNIKKNFGNNKDDLTIDEYVKWSKLWMNEFVRVLKDTGSIFIYGFSEILAYLSVNLPLEKRWLVWHYTNKTTPSYTTGWQRSHESIIYAWKNNPIFNVDEVRIPYTKAYLKTKGKKRKGLKTARFGDSDDTTYNVHEKGALPRDVFTDISALAGGAGRSERYFMYKDEVYPPNRIEDFPIEDIIKHPTQKPLKLTERLILSSKPDGKALVVIPFGGSGSEGIICKRMGIDFLGFDNNPIWIKMSNKAVEKFSP
jgi:site-specific DNA-methyltransferase (adenine-specific)